FRHLEYLRNALAVPAVDQVLRLHAGADHVGIERRHAFAARVPHAVEGDAVGAIGAQHAGQRHAGHVAVGIVRSRPTAADVVQPAVQARAVAAHLDFAGGLARGGEEALAVIYGLLDRGGHAVRGIEHAPAAIRKAAAFRVEVGERGHHRGRTRPAQTTLLRHLPQRAGLLAQARVFFFFKQKTAYEIGRIGDAVVDADRRKTAGHDAKGLVPADAFDGWQLGRHRISKVRHLL